MILEANEIQQGRLIATVYSRRHCNTSIRSSRWLMNLRIMESGGVSISAVGGYVARSIWMKNNLLSVRRSLNTIKGR
jgi:hypothetical protein